MKSLRIGYIPLIDAAIPIAASECGFAEKEGLRLELIREVSWANIRDKLTHQVFDAAHMLAPLAVATSLGLGHAKVSLAAPFALNANGNCITLAASLYRTMEEILGHAPADAQESAQAMRAIVDARQRQGLSPLTFGVVFPFSVHAILVRHWLRLGGVDPNRDIQLVVVPPPFMVQSLSNGLLDGYCVGEPWNSRAVESGVGCIVAFGAELNRLAPDKVLALREDGAEENGEALEKLLRAYRAAAEWCESEANHSNLANILAQSQYLNVAPRTILGALKGSFATTRTDTRQVANFLRFGDMALNRPDPRRARWIYAETMHALQRPLSEEGATAAAAVYRPDLFDAAIKGNGPDFTGDPIGLTYGPAFSSDDLDGYLAALTGTVSS